MHILFFLIFGTRGVTSLTDRGEFTCPHCRGRRSYVRKQVRRFFTLFFIPLVPLDLVGEYVECSGCSGTYKPEVLSLGTPEHDERVMAEFQVAVRDVMIGMMWADGQATDDEVSTIARIYSQLTGSTITSEAIRTQARRRLVGNSDPVAIARRQAPMLNPQGKELVIQAAWMVAVADGTLTKDEEKLLTDLGSALEMSRAHLRGVLMSMAEGAAA